LIPLPAVAAPPEDRATLPPGGTPGARPGPRLPARCLVPCLGRPVHPAQRPGTAPLIDSCTRMGPTAVAREEKTTDLMIYLISHYFNAILH